MDQNGFDGDWQLACLTIRGAGFLGASLRIQGTQADVEIDQQMEGFPVIGLLSGGLAIQEQTKGTYTYDAEMRFAELPEQALVGLVTRSPTKPGGEDDDTDVFIATRKPPAKPSDGK